MTKVKRQIITIDEEKCDGCGACVPSCAEGALQVVDGKARLVKESYCDGLGACLGECPQAALRVVEMEVEAYDELAVLGYLQQVAPHMVEKHVAHLREHGLASAYNPAPAGVAACPSVQVRAWDEARRRDGSPAAIPLFAARAAAAAPRLTSELRQWPVQLHLVPIRAPFFADADLALIADCVPFAEPNTHADFIRGHAIAVGCPKLDDGRAYIAKLSQILQHNDIRSLTVVRMEVPCCGGLEYIAQQALALSGKQIPFKSLIVTIQAA
ncbi:MAG: ATP-binding protein [Anaerolineae bacterium]